MLRGELRHSWLFTAIHSTDPLDEICAHVDEGPARGLSIEKIRDRGRVLDVTEDAIEVEVERHTSASGAMYREGLAMSACRTDGF